MVGACALVPIAAQLTLTDCMRIKLKIIAPFYLLLQVALTEQLPNLVCSQILILYHHVVKYQNILGEFMVYYPRNTKMQKGLGMEIMKAIQQNIST